ncbi:MAG TPA: glycosyltransferase family 1 protein, partial [Candidatus Dormibacteraeota bacterium]
PQHRGAWLFAQAWLRLAARGSRVEAVHVSDPHALLTLPGRHLLTTVHDLIPLAEGMPTRRVVERLGYRRYLEALRHTDTLFAVSPHTRTALAALTGRSAAEIIIARVGISAPPGPAPGAPSAGAPYFLYVGGPDRTKNVATLLEAMALAPDIPERLTIAGQWTRRQHLVLDRDLARLGIAGRVRHVGFVPQVELEGLLRGATAVITPSRREGFGLPVAEAMARGIPVGHSDIDVLNDVSGGAAVTFDPDDAADIARALRQLSGDPEPRTSLVAAGLKRAAGLTWETTINVTLDAYRRAAG